MVDIHDDTQSLAAFTAELAKELAAPDPQVWHAVADGLTVAGRVLVIGDELVVDEALIEKNRDAYGHSNLEDLSDEAQLAAWHRVFLAPGPVESDITLSEQIAADAAQLVAQQEQERIRQNHRYGKKN